MRRADMWTEIEDRLLLGGFEDRLSSPEIVELLKREGYGRSDDAIRRRYQRLMEKETKQYNGGLQAKRYSGCGDMDGHRLECKRNERADKSFQQIMQREGYRRESSKTPGTEHPRTVASASVGSCTSSAGWAV